MRIFSLLLLLLLIAPARAEITFEGAERDRFEIVDQTLMVYSGMGIGRVKVKPCPENGWSGLKRVCLKYANGKGMSWVEGLVLTSAGKTVRSSGRLKKESDNWFLGGPSQGRLRVSFPENALTVELPTELLGDSPLLEIHWVDFYRR